MCKALDLITSLGGKTDLFITILGKSPEAENISVGQPTIYLAYSRLRETSAMALDIAVICPGSVCPHEVYTNASALCDQKQGCQYIWIKQPL
jgi:hypothetical protein